jgi:hypothetical protein
MRARPALIFVALLGASFLTACAAPTASPRYGTPMEEVRVEAAVERDGDRWTVDYVLDRDAPAWAFRRSALLRESRRPWRPDWWSVRTAGVVLERIGDYDVLRSVDGGPVPRRVRIAMTGRWRCSRSSSTSFRWPLPRPPAICRTT